MGRVLSILPSGPYSSPRIPIRRRYMLSQATAAWRPSAAILAALACDLSWILHTDFRERPFYEVG
jgi:hypothetical protein